MRVLPDGVAIVELCNPPVNALHPNGAAPPLKLSLPPRVSPQRLLRSTSRQLQPLTRLELNL